MTNQTEYGYQPTATNMVAVVRNIIDGYRMGAVRALAQEPVQNSKDAATSKSTRVRVDFELHRRELRNGEPAAMLTITDSGTTGLGGPILESDQIARLGGVMPAGYDWNAFEGQGYTKQDEDALGSRGQGKSAMLYASRPPVVDSSRPRMVIVYDTLLPGDRGEYRLGVRYANPADQIRERPFMDEAAKTAVSAAHFSIDDGLEFPIALEPLQRPGTRIIIPFLSEEVESAIVSGEFAKWLQILWWRLIQLGKLELRVIHSGAVDLIKVPTWWEDEPWSGNWDPTEMIVEENVTIPSSPEYKIKRIVFRCDNTIPEHESLIGGKEPEFDGIQLLRGGQWIETLGRPETWFTKLVPEELRSRFRGFVEFDQRLDRELRGQAYESPQHDDFRRTTGLVRSLIDQVELAVTELSHAAGWSTGSVALNEPDEVERDVARRFLSKFTEPLTQQGETGGTNTGDENKLNVELSVEYPTPQSARVNWGEWIRDVHATCATTPEYGHGDLEMILSVVGPEHGAIELARQTTSFNVNGVATSRFSDIMVIRGMPGGGNGRSYASCSEPGRYRIQLEVSSSNSRPTKASRSVFVEVDPPPPPDNPISLSVTTKNAADPERVRINNGEALQVGISIRNRGVDDLTLFVDASVNATEVPSHLVAGVDTPRSLPLLTRQSVVVPGTGQAGQTADLASIYNGSVRLFGDRFCNGTAPPHIVLEPGDHYVAVDVRDADDNVISSTSRRFWFEMDPPRSSSGGLPFDLEPRGDDPSSLGQASSAWEFGPEQEDAPRKLLYSLNHPTYIAAKDADQRWGRRKPMTRAYLAEICAFALVDWMLEPFLESGDESRFVPIESRREVSNWWHHLADQLETFRTMCRDRANNSVYDLGNHQRMVVAQLVRMFDEDPEAA